MQPNPLEAAAPPLVLPGINTTAGLRHVGGDQAFYVRLLEHFWHAHAGTAAALQREAAQDECDALALRAHTLRGSAASVGAEQLRQAAEALELVAGQPGAGSAQLAALLPALDEVMAGLAAFFSSQHDPNQDSLLNKAESLAAKAQLVVLLDDFSGDTLDYFVQVRSSLAQLMPEPAMQELARYIERYEFQAARRLLDSTLSKSG